MLPIAGEGRLFSGGLLGTSLVAVTKHLTKATYEGRLYFSPQLGSVAHHGGEVIVAGQEVS